MQHVRSKLLLKIAGDGERWFPRRDDKHCCLLVFRIVRYDSAEITAGYALAGGSGPASSVGDVIAYTLTIKNDGALTLSAVSPLNSKVTQNGTLLSLDGQMCALARINGGNA